MYLLPADRLYATYFEGDDGLGLPPDEEARDLWRRFLPEDRIIPGNKADNFWEMGDQVRPPPLRCVLCRGAARGPPVGGRAVAQHRRRVTLDDALFSPPPLRAACEHG